MIPTQRKDAWTEEKTAKLLNMREAGMSYKECAFMLGVTEIAVMTRLSRIRCGNAPNGTRPFVMKRPLVTAPRTGLAWDFSPDELALVRD